MDEASVRDEFGSNNSEWQINRQEKISLLWISKILIWNYLQQNNTEAPTVAS